MQDTRLSKIQIKKGLIIILFFIILRIVGARLWERFFGGISYQVSLKFVLFLFTVFLVTSVGLVYFGFTKWVGVDIKKWWFNRKTIWGDIAWGLLTFLILGLSFTVLAMVLNMFGITPEKFGMKENSPPQLHLIPIKLALGLFFGFAIAAFQEETMFRGFLQNVLTEKFGNWRGNILQAALFSIAHIGLEPFNSMPQILFLFLLRLMAGIIFGWLRTKRGTLLAPAIAHGIMG